MNRHSTATLIVVAAISFILGALIFHRFAPPAAATAATPAIPGSRPATKGDAAQPSAVTALREENLRLQRKLTDTTHEQKQALAAAIMDDRLRLWEETESNNLYITPFSIDGNGNIKLTSDVIRVLDLSPAQATQVQAAFDRAADKLSAIEARHFKITEETAEKTAFEISPYPEGSDLKAELINSLNEALGERKAKIFLHESAPILTSHFSDFGTAKLTRVEILWGKTQKEDRIRQTTEGPTGTMSMTGPLSALPDRYRALIKLDDNR